METPTTHDPGAGGRRAAVLALVVYSTLLLSPSLLYAVLLPNPDNYSWQPLAYALALWVAWLALVGNLWLACLIASPFLLLVPVEGYLLVRYQSPLQPQVFGILRETNAAEALEYGLGLWLPALLGCAALGAAAAICLRAMRRARLRWRSRWRLALPAALLLLGAGFHFAYEDQEAAAALLPQADPLAVPPPPFLVERLRETSPFGVPFRAYVYLKTEENLARLEASMKGWRFGATQRAGTPQPQVFVLVIGESARADRWQVNGYARPTSPRLAATRNLVSFTDLVAVASVSRLAIPAILARGPAERSLVTAFREAGFRTHWLSTQGSTGGLDAPITFYAREAEVVRFFNPSGYLQRTPFDGALLAELESALAERRERQLIVLHTLGSHFHYRYRYPPEFEAFRPAGSASLASLGDAAAAAPVNNAYDNSILYTDHFLGEIIAALERSGRAVAAMLYVSDHGEDLFDRGCPALAGHGRATRASFHVPGFFWYSDGFARAYPEKLERLRRNKDARLSTSSVFPTLLDAAGISFPGEDPSASLFSSSFRPGVRRVTSLHRTVDYDRAKPAADCQLVD